MLPTPLSVVRGVIGSTIGALVLGFFGLLTRESVLFVLIVIAILLGLVSLGISAHALRISRDTSELQAARMDALDNGGG